MKLFCALMFALGLLACAVALGPGCSLLGPPCTGDPSKMNCTCGGQRNPGCLPWLTDAKKPKTDGGIDR